MASWNIPALINKISEDVPAIKALLTALFKWTDADTTDVPVGAKRLQDVAGGKQIQEYSGSAWGNVGKLMHDVDMLDGKHASTAQTADTIPVRDANGTIPGNISGNAATATEASSLASGYTVPVANGGTGATSEAGARASLGADNASNISSGILDIAYGGTGSSQKNFVDLTENQNVGGTKTFSSEIKSTAETLISSVMTGVSIADTTRGQTSQKLMAVVYDKNGKRSAGFAADAYANGSRAIHMHMRNRADTGWVYGYQLLELADGTVKHLVSTPPGAADDTQIATTTWVRNATGNTSLNAATATKATQDKNGLQIDTGYLKLASGTLSNTLEIKGSGKSVDVTDTSLERGTAPGSTQYRSPFIYRDKNNRTLAMLYGEYFADKSSWFGLLVYSHAVIGSTYQKISIGYDSNGNWFTYAPTPATADNTTKIATTAFVKAQGYITTPVPAGTRMLFQQSAAPTGWTKETGSGYNNTALRFVTGNIGNKTNGKAFTTCMASGRGSSSNTQGGTVGNCTLSDAQIPKHSGSLWNFFTGANAGANGIFNTFEQTDNRQYTLGGSWKTFATNFKYSFGGGGAHNHSFTGSSHSHTVDLDINYIDCIIAKKN